MLLVAVLVVAVLVVAEELLVVALLLLVVVALLLVSTAENDGSSIAGVSSPLEQAAVARVAAAARPAMMARVGRRDMGKPFVEYCSTVRICYAPSVPPAVVCTSQVA